MAFSVSGVGFVRSLSRKRILVRSASAMEDHHHCSDLEASAGPLKRQCSSTMELDAFQFLIPSEMTDNSNKSVLESLPQEILIKIICGVDHDDLDQLYQVSKPVHEAAKIARETHFAYATPKKIRVFKNWMCNSPGRSSSSSSEEEEEEEAPNAPLRPRRFKPSQKQNRKLKKKMLIPEEEDAANDLTDISVALFTSSCSSDSDSDSDNWPRRKLF